MSSSREIVEPPDRLRRLPELARNLYWSWHPAARDLFQMLDPALWNDVQHNPVRLLLELRDPEARRSQRLLAAAADPAILRQYEAVLTAFDAYMTNDATWFSRHHPALLGRTIAYVSFEFGIHSSLPTYAGGLGVLAGDHCKEASDLGVPLIGIGFMYPQGYLHQRISPDGWQESVDEHVDYGKVPAEPVLDTEGRPLLIRVPLSTRAVHLAVWKVSVGRVPLYLMDTNVKDNEPWDRELSARLYGGGQELRIQQETVLGIGSVRVLRALGIEPTVWHVNEGHGAFLLIERVRELVQSGRSFKEATEIVRATSVFTTHTPVPAGHDAFPFPRVEEHFSYYWDQLGLSRAEFLEIAAHQEPWGPAFNMTVLALRLAGHRNGVSRAHGLISRQMWRAVWPELSEEDVPIASVTNGVHVPTWIAPEMDRLYKRYLGLDWVARHDEPALWERVLEIPDSELWAVHLHLKHKLMSFIRERARQEWISGRMSPEQVLTAGALLDPGALTIGFARRFATYKRADLILRDMARLKRILQDPRRPVQIVFAGKAHPADEPGSRVIHEVYAVAKDYELGSRIAFVEDYDMHVAKYLVHGVDVWLNTPSRPREASGTSGQKAALNGVPHLSFLDGWWVEGYLGGNGWAIGADAEPVDPGAQDDADSRALYRVLEEEVIPLFYERERDGVPRDWLTVMKEAIRTCAPAFSARRMVKEYAQRMYAPAAHEL